MDARADSDKLQQRTTAAATAQTATGFGLATSQPMAVPTTQRARVRPQPTHATSSQAAAQTDSAPGAVPPAAQAAVTAPRAAAFYSGFILAPDSLHSHASFSRLAAMPLPNDSIVPASPIVQPPLQSASSSSSFTARSFAAAAAGFSAAPPFAVIPRPTSCRVELLEEHNDDETESASYKAVARLPPHLQPRSTSAAQRMTCCGKSIGRTPGVALRCITREEAAQLDQASVSPSASPVADARGGRGQSPTSPASASAGFDLEFDL